VNRANPHCASLPRQIGRREPRSRYAKSDRDCKRAEIAINTTSMSRRGENLRPFQFRKGGPPGPGRPPGSRSKLNELALSMLSADFARHGEQVIERVRKRKPEAYLAGVLSLLPRQSQIEKTSAFSELSDQELDLLETHLAALRAKTINELELKAADGTGAAASRTAVKAETDAGQLSLLPDDLPEPAK
jgi:hypothetical protein